MEHSGSRRRLVSDAALLTLGLVGAAALLAVYNHVRFGSPLASDYSPSFGLEGFWGLTALPGGSVVPVRTRRPRGGRGCLDDDAQGESASAVLIGGTFVVFFLFFASLEDWLGDRTSARAASSRRLLSCAWQFRSPTIALRLPGVVRRWRSASTPGGRASSTLASSREEWHWRFRWSGPPSLPSRRRECPELAQPVLDDDGGFPGVAVKSGASARAPRWMACLTVRSPDRARSGRLDDGRPERWDQARSNRSRFMTLSHAATKSRTNFSRASSHA